MNNSNSIASIYQIVENIEFFEAEQLYLVSTEDDSTRQYWLQHIDLRNRSPGETKLIQDTISTIKSISSTQLDRQQFTNLVEVIEVENTIDLVYEKVAGTNLKTPLEDADCRVEIEIVRLLKNLLIGLKLIHDRGLVHQMIKPQNLTFTDNDRRIIFNNYGKVTADSYSYSMATMSFEDTRYITQEQLKGKATPSSDIYALGMTIVTSVIGVSASSLEENDAGTWNWSENQNFSDRFVNIIDKMTHRKTRSRYQEVGEILAAIEQSFPELEQNNISSVEADYTKTQIITIEPSEPSEPIEIEKEPQKEEEQIRSEETSSPPLALDKTQIVPPESIEPENILESEPEPENNDDNKPTVTYTAQTPTLINDSTQVNDDSFVAENDRNSDDDSNNINEPNNKPNLFSNLTNKIKTTQGIIAIVILVALAILGINIYQNYRYQKKVENLISQIEDYYQNDEFNNCITLINSTDTQSLPIANALTKEFLGKCWLGLAESQALERNFAEAIRIAVKVNKKSPDYERARTFINDWSEQLLKEAQIICENGGDIEEANQRLNSIPESSIWKKQALNLSNKCSQMESLDNLDSSDSPTINDGVVEVCPGPLCPE